MNQPKTVYTFERTELRVLQNMCNDNEDFLNAVATIIGNRNTEIDELKHELGMLKAKLLRIELGD